MEEGFVTGGRAAGLWASSSSPSSSSVRDGLLWVRVQSRWRKCHVRANDFEIRTNAGSSGEVHTGRRSVNVLRRLRTRLPFAITGERFKMYLAASPSRELDSWVTVLRKTTMLVTGVPTADDVEQAVAQFESRMCCNWCHLR